MGWGYAEKIKLVALSTQQGVDGIEPIATETANIYAQVTTINQNRGFDANRGNYKTQYQFLIYYDSAIDINIAIMIEYNNRRYSTQSIERVDIIKANNRYSNQTTVNPNGRYWRIVATSEDIS